MKLLPLLFVSLPLIAPVLLRAEPAPTRPVLLVVVAHPDDEAAFAPALVKYASTHRVQLVVITDGRLGIRPGFPTGDALVALREQESAAACQQMNLERPVFLHFPDGFDSRAGVGEFLTLSRRCRSQLTELVRQFSPAAILTFGPDGDTGHPDHRLAGNFVTEVVLRENWVARFPTYYLGWSPAQAAKSAVGELNTVSPGCLDVAIHFTEAEEDLALATLSCYASQLSAADIQEWTAAEKKDPTNVLSFRQLIVSGNSKAEF